MPDLAFQSYELTTGQGDAWGDGVIPVDAALALPGAESLALDGVYHGPTTSESWRLDSTNWVLWVYECIVLLTAFVRCSISDMRRLLLGWSCVAAACLS